METVVIPGTPNLADRDPDCEMCQHQYFTPHLHTDGSARVISRDCRTVYILQVVEDVVTCSCPNGQHTDPGKEPRCWHTATYKKLLETPQPAVAGRPSRIKLEDLF